MPDNFDCRPNPNTTRIDYKRDETDIFLSVSAHQIMQLKIPFKVNRIVEVKLKIGLT